MSVREYHSSDEAALQACVAALQDYEKSINPLTAAPEEMMEAYLFELFGAEDQSLSRVFVKVVELQVVGFVAVQARLHNEEPHEVDYMYAYISEVAVLEKFRSQGFGRELLLHAEDYARKQGATLMRIGSLWRNRSAYDLYKTLGYAEHAVLLQKDLSHDVR